MRFEERLAEERYYAGIEYLEKGREEERSTLIRNFLKAGTPINFIMAATGWTQEQINKVAQQDD